MENELKCIGCGAVLQSDNPDKAGYIKDISKIDDSQTQTVYCQRCFRMRNYNDSGEISLENDEFDNLINKIGNQVERNLIYVIDIFDLENGLIPQLNRKFLNWPVMVVLNKIDLLPESSSVSKIKQKIIKRFDQMHIKANDIITTSATKNIGIDELFEKIQLQLQENPADTYIFGAANAGKSTILNHILKANGYKDEVITTSFYPGTTLNVINIPLDDGYNLIDTPGFVTEESILDHIDSKYFKNVIPKKEIKPIILQLNPDQTIFIDGLGYIDFGGTNAGTLILNFSNALKIHRTKTINRDNIWNKRDKLFKNQLNENEKLFEKSFKIGNAAEDISISGLGWVKASPNTKITTHFPKKVKVIKRATI